MSAVAAGHPGAVRGMGGTLPGLESSSPLGPHAWNRLSFFERLFLPSVPKEPAKESPERPESGCEILGRGCEALGLLSHTVVCGGVSLARGKKMKRKTEKVNEEKRHKDPASAVTLFWR